MILLQKVKKICSVWRRVFPQTEQAIRKSKNVNFNKLKTSQRLDFLGICSYNNILGDNARVYMIKIYAFIHMHCEDMYFNNAMNMLQITPDCLGRCFF